MSALVGHVTPSVIVSPCEEHLGAVPFGNGLDPVYLGLCGKLGMSFQTIAAVGSMYPVEGPCVAEC